MILAPLATLVLAVLPQQVRPAAPPLRDTTPPRIASLKVEQHGNGEATVSWATDEATSGRVAYGGSLPLSSSVGSNTIGREHRVRLTSLPMGKARKLRVFAEDRVGNVGSTPVESLLVAGPTTGQGFEVAGALRPWYPVTLRFEGPFATELDDAPNPFLDYRLEVDLVSPAGEEATIPGFFDGDGRGGGAGSLWSVRFPTHLPGTWSFTARFRSGTDVAISLDPGAGAPAAFDGLQGTFTIGPVDPEAPGLYARGKLLPVGGHYLRFADGTYFLKGGTNSPENLLGYAGFDNTLDQGGLSTSGLPLGLHHFEAHEADFGPPALGGLGDHDDPLFRSAERPVDSRGLIGAINYLASVGLNSVYFLPMNLGGDGWEVCPYVGYRDTDYDKTHFDLSKLWQWNETMLHAERRGITIQFVLAEAERTNRNWLDGGTLGPERKLFYREMIARFGHLPAIKWNLSEESEFPMSTMLEFIDYVRALDPYNHLTTFHVHLLPTSGESAQYESILGDPRVAGTSLQAIPYTASDLVEKWRADSKAAGHPWVVDFDEQLTALTDTNADELRKLQLYDTLLSGGHVEWYAGYLPLPLGGDLRLEDFRRREAMWNYTAHARRLLEEEVPYWAMEPRDGLVRGETNAYGGAEVLVWPGRYYVIYLPEGTATGELDLSEARHALRARWYDPRAGVFVGNPATLAPGGWAKLPPAPAPASEDWVLLVER